MLTANSRKSDIPLLFAEPQAVDFLTQRPSVYITYDPARITLTSRPLHADLWASNHSFPAYALNQGSATTRRECSHPTHIAITYTHSSPSHTTP